MSSSDCPSGRLPADPATLAAAEKRYLARLRDRYGPDAPYYIPLAGETTEAAPLEAEAPLNFEAHFLPLPSKLLNPSLSMALGLFDGIRPPTPP